MYPAALQNIPTRTVDSSQVLTKSKRQKQPQTIKRITENWHKSKIRDLEQVCPKHEHNLLSTF